MQANLLAGIFGFAVLTLSVTAGTAKEGWTASDNGRSAATSDSRGHNLSIECSDGGELMITYSLPIIELAGKMESLDKQYMLFMIEQLDATHAIYLTAYSANDEDIARIGSVGDEVAEIARNIGGATGNILVGIMPDPPSVDFLLYNAARFPGTGSKSAIRGVLAACDLLN